MKMGITTFLNVIERLVGKTEPVGDSAIDSERYDNLVFVIEILYWAINKLNDLSKYKISPYYSEKEIGERAYSELLIVGEYLNENLQEMKRLYE